MVNYPLTTEWTYSNGLLGIDVQSQNYVTFTYACTDAADPDNCTWPPGTEPPSHGITLDAGCGTVDNATQGCIQGTWQDDPGDGWTCLGENGGSDAPCPAQAPAPFSCHPFTGTFAHGTWTRWVDYGILGTVPPPCLTSNACAGAQGDWLDGFLPNASDPDCLPGISGTGCDYCGMPLPVPQPWSDWYTPAMHGHTP